MTRSLLQASLAEHGQVSPALEVDLCLRVHALASTLCPILVAVVARTFLSIRQLQRIFCASKRSDANMVSRPYLSSRYEIQRASGTLAAVPALLATGIQDENIYQIP